MQEVNFDQVVERLKTVGILPGDGVLVHSAIQYLGRPAGGVGTYFEVICSVLGIPSSQGTLVVPTFNFGFARGEPYDPHTTPSKGMGAFSEWVRQHPAAKRTSHPMQSLAAVGFYADDLASRDTPGAFDPGSAFERMLELDFKILLLGADVNSISILHYSEQRAEAPYRYWKEFSGQVLLQGDRDNQADVRFDSEGYFRTEVPFRTYRMYVRDLDLDPRLDLLPVQVLLEAREQWRIAPLNYGLISSCRMADFVAAVDDFLQADPWSLVTNRP